MDNLEKGSWIINTIKHTTGVRTDTVELNDLEITERAGKAGILLGKLLVDKNVIISLFNESQSYYKKYKELIDGNSIEAQKVINTAGNKLQQSYELGLKCYLNRKYKELHDSGNISGEEYRNLTSIIENGRQPRGALVQLLIIVLKLTKKMEPLFLLSIYQESRILILKDYIEICKLDSIFIQINLLYI